MEEEIDFAAQTIGDVDPKSTRAQELLERIETDAEVPRKFKRIAARSNKWGIPRSFVGYRVAPTTQIGGYAPKWVLVSEDGGPDYIVKRPTYRGGPMETLTELLINRLGEAYGFDMAHSGMVSIDGRPAFITRSFLKPKEHLIHGSALIEDYYSAPRGELDTVPHGRKEQEFYSLDFVVPTIQEHCGKDGGAIISKFVEMLVFDALIGATDRHAQNWGVIRESTTQGGYRFSPIFDTSRGLFWNLPDVKISELARNNKLLSYHIDRACPVMGPERQKLRTRRHNHFQFLSSLFAAFPHLRVTAVTKVPCSVQRATFNILKTFPFRGAFSKVRRDTILKLILLRSDLVSQVLEAGEGVKA